MIEVGKEYYVVSDIYDWIDPMEKVEVHTHEDGEMPFVVHRHEDGSWLTSGYIDEYDLLSADEIIKVWHNHRMMVDSFERHG